MNPDALHARARQMAAQSPTPMTVSEALAELGRRGAAKRRRASRNGVLHPTRDDRKSFQHVETPVYWWQRD